MAEFNGSEAKRVYCRPSSVHEKYGTESKGAKAKQILPMANTTTANIPNKTLSHCICNSRVNQGLETRSSANSILGRKKVKLFHKRAPFPGYNPRGIPFSKENTKSPYARPYSVTKGSDDPMCIKKKSPLKNLSSGLETAKRSTWLIQDVPNLCSPFFSLSLALKEVVPVSPKLGGGELFLSSSWPKRA